jgi:hypothetical protein
MIPDSFAARNNILSRLSDPGIPGYIRCMTRTGALVLYRNRPATVTATEGDKLVVRLQDGESQKVREKDIILLHAGPVSRIL